MYKYTYADIYINPYLHAYTHVCVYLSVFECIPVCACTRVIVYPIYYFDRVISSSMILTGFDNCVFNCIYIHTYMQAYIHTYTRARVFGWTRTSVLSWNSWRILSYFGGDSVRRDYARGFWSGGFFPRRFSLFTVMQGHHMEH